MVTTAKTMTMSATIGKLAMALAKAQGAMKPAVKDRDNTFFGSRYADLASVWESCRKPLSDNELSVIQTTESENSQQVTVVTMLAHSSGEWIMGRLTLAPIPNDKKTKGGEILGQKAIGPQDITAAVTYGRRATLSAIVGVATEDDDGESISGRKLGEVAPEGEINFTNKQKETPNLERAKAEGRVFDAYTGKKLKPGEEPNTAGTKEPEKTKAEPEKPATQPAAEAEGKNTTGSAFNGPLYDALALVGVSDDELTAYLKEKGILTATQSIHNLKAEKVEKILRPDNWEKIVRVIENKRSEAQ